MAAPGFWDDQQKANKIIQEMKSFKAKLEPWEASRKELEELSGLAEITEPSDDASIAQLSKDLDGLTQDKPHRIYRLVLGGARQGRRDTFHQRGSRGHRVMRLGRDALQDVCPLRPE